MSFWKASIFVLMLFTTNAAIAGLIFSTVAVSGQQAAGVESGVNYLNFREGSALSNVFIDAAGNVTFRAQLSGIGINASNDFGIWGGTTGSLRLVAREGDRAPGMPDGVVYGTLPRDVAISNGHVVFAGSVAGAGITTSNDSAIWEGVPATVQLIIQEGNATIGAGGASVFGGMIASGINSAGIIAMAAGIRTGTISKNSLWVGPPTSLSLVAQEDGPAPGTITSFLTLNGSVVDASGRLAFTGRIAQGGFPTPQGVWRGAAGSVQLAALENQPVPGIPGDATFKSINGVSVGASGVLGVLGTVWGTGITTENDDGIWVGTPESLKLVARAGSAAPDLAGSTFYDTMYLPDINSSGSIAMRASTIGDTGVTNAIFAGLPNALHVRVRSGNRALQLPSGDVFFNSFGDPIINSQGDLAFFALLRGIAVSSDNDGSIWILDHGGQLYLVAREGDQFDVGGGDLRTIFTLPVDSLERRASSGRSHFNDAGRFSFMMAFNDGSSGVFVASLPEPSTVVVLSMLIGITGITRRCRHRVLF